MNSESLVRDFAERLPSTIELALVAFVAAALLGALVGYLRARVRAPALREVLSVPPLLARAMPVVILSLFLQIGMMVAGLPVALASSSDAFDLRDRLLHLIAPVLCLAVPFAAWSSLIFFDFFRAPKGAARVRVRSLLAPLASTAASIGPALLATSVLFVEPRFAWPGIGRLLYNGFGEFEFRLVATCLVVYAAAVVLMKLFGRLAPATSNCVTPDSAARQTPPRGRARISVLAALALVVLLVAIVGALGADVIAPIGPYFIDQEHWQGYPLAPGTFGHVLGTEENGRDLLARLLVALRFSLGIAACAALLAAAIAALVAKVAKALPWFEGRSAPGTAGIRPFGAFPFIIAAIMVLVDARHNVRFLTPAFIALLIALVSWPAIVSAFRGSGRARLASVVDVAACALLLEVTQSSIGWGVQPPAPTLGNMLANAQSNLTVAPWAAIVPSAVTVVVLFALYALGDELRERARAVL